MIAPGQSIQQSQLNDLAALANAKLPLAHRIDGVLRDGDNVPFNAAQHSRGEYVEFFPNLSTPQTAYAFGSDGWRSELLRLRVNLRWWIEFARMQAGGERLGPERMVSGEWPIIPRNYPLWGWSGLGVPALGVNGIIVAYQKNLYDFVAFCSPANGVTFTLKTQNEPDVELSAYSTPIDAVSTVPILRYDVFIPTLTGKYAAVYASTSDGIFFIREQFAAPNMNPFSVAAPWIHADERIGRFALLQHRAMAPYAELPTPYPPAPVMVIGDDLGAEPEGYYDGLADYNYAGRLNDPSGPHSPSKSSYFRSPCYPARKKSDGEYAPFTTESIALGDFGQVIHRGMIYSVTISRPVFDAAGTFTLGNFIGGVWQPMHTETLSAGERSKTIYPRWPVMNDAPIYYEGPDDCNVQLSFVARANVASRLSIDVQWPIHSCYYNDTEALLNLL